MSEHRPVATGEGRDVDLSPSASTADEVGVLARETARAYREMARFYRDQLGLSGQEADARARGTDDTPEQAVADLARIRERPPDQLSWYDLERVLNRDPEAMAALWEDVKEEARRELRTGHRSAQALEWGGSPWQRARYLAVRQSLRGDMEPRSGLESRLLDMAAEAWSSWAELSEQALRLMATEAELERDDLERSGRWKPPHQLVTEHTERIQRMAEAAHQRFVKTVRMLTELRRSTQLLYVGHVEQVNVGHQQVNLSNHQPQGGGEGQDG